MIAKRHLPIAGVALLATFAFLTAEAPPAVQTVKGAVPHRAPLRSAPFISLPLGSVKARGWLAHQLELQAEGLTGRGEEVIPELDENNAWRGGGGESWEKGPYFLRGLVSLAWVKDDPKLQEQAMKWIDWLLENQRADGQIGPASNEDWWPRMVIAWTLRDYHEATGDPRVIPVLTRYARYMQANLPKRPLEKWARARAADQIDTLYWLYNRTGEDFLLEVADLLREQANEWMSFFPTLRGAPADFRIDHGVNVSQAMKYPIVTYERTKSEADGEVFRKGWEELTKAHGLPIGLWSGTERLAGRSTLQGIEMCTIVEQMLSSEVALEALGSPWIADELERIAFNLLPGGTTKEFKQFQYYTLPNAPVAKKNPPGAMPFRDDHGDDLLCSPHSGFHCCCYNLHMGWPKYVQHLWMATADGGLAAMAYGPSEVTATIGEAKVVLTEETGYPFSDTLRFTVKTDREVRFPLKLRIPGWAVRPRVAVNGESVEGVRSGEFLTLTRTWKTGDVVAAEYPAELEARDGYRGSAALWRGPLVFSLRLKEKAKVVTPIPGGFDETELTPESPWNYALDIDRDQPAAAVKFHTTGKVPRNPWLPDTTPLKLTVPAKRIPGWQLARDGFAADEVPESPVASSEPVEQITLVPFGTQTLRITAFPLLRGKALLERSIAASHQNGENLEGVLSQPTPSASSDGRGRFTFWNHRGTNEWIEWNFGEIRRISSVSIYWFDDTGSGQCRVPASWTVFYRKNGMWTPVENPSAFGVEADRSNRVTFDEVETPAIKIAIRLQPGFSAGLLQLGAE